MSKKRGTADKGTLQLYIVERGALGYNVIGVYRWIFPTF